MQALAPRKKLLFTRGYIKRPHYLLDQNHPLSRGLVGCWPMGDGQAGQNHDVSQYGRNAAIIGTTASAAPPSHHGGVAFSTNSAQAYGLATSAALTYPLSLCCWVNFANSPSTNNGYIPIALSNTTGNINFYLRLARGAIFDQTEVNAFDGTNQRRLINNNSLQSPGSWHHHVAIFQDSSNFAWYYDGVLQSGSYDKTNTPTPAGINAACLGTLLFNTSSLFSSLDGYMDGARIYNRVLSDAEIAILYQEPYAGLVPRAPNYLFGRSGVPFCQIPLS